MGFIQDDAGIVPVQEGLRGLAFRRHEAGGEETDSARTCGRRRWPDDAVLGDPAVIDPARRRDREHPQQLLLPLQQEVLGREHEHWVVVRKGYELGGHAELDRLSEPDVIGEDEARLAEDIEVTHHPGHERPLVRREPDALARGRRLDEGRLLVGRRVPFGDLDDPAVEDTLDVLDDDISKRPGVAVRPKRFELRLNPGDRRRVLVLPQQLVVTAPRFAGLVDRAEEAGAAAVGIADDPSLAVDQAERGVGQHPHLDALRAQEPRQTLVARPLAAWSSPPAGPRTTR